VSFDKGVEQDVVCPLTCFVVVVTGFWVPEVVMVAVASLVMRMCRQER
jgi:hypothetical protein